MRTWFLDHVANYALPVATMRHVGIVDDAHAARFARHAAQCHMRVLAWQCCCLRVVTQRRVDARQRADDMLPFTRRSPPARRSGTGECRAHACAITRSSFATLAAVFLRPHVLACRCRHVCHAQECVPIVRCAFAAAYVWVCAAFFFFRCFAILLMLFYVRWRYATSYSV